MFKKLTHFAYKRTKKEALGFYLAYFLFIVLAASLAGGMHRIVTGKNDILGAMGAGVLTAVVIVLTLSFLILMRKKLMGSFGLLLLSIFAGILAFAAGGLLGLIPVAYMTTRESRV